MSSNDTRALFIETKKRLIERLNGNINNWGSLVRQIVRGSKTPELLSQCTKTFANHEHAIGNTETHIDRILQVNKSMLQPIEPKSFDL
ncbi:uncharacterized protein LOC107361730 [Tetranychus urticae]|uniref:BLOC-1-related complex subunit 7 n=1 Tax=Tetranychus urticae TaxID=32264 RepID=T1JQG5_TETUR|nr:uncharacterized protein LOC107361730 [Tetranychus urticae]